MRQQFEKIANGTPAATDRKPLQYFGDKYKQVMIKAVKNSPMQSAARSATVIESSIVIRRSRMFSKASRKIG
jgi:hypothetical protein